MKIVEEPVKELVVHEMYKMSLNDLVMQMVKPDGRPFVLFWCDGIVYSYFVLAEKAWDEELLKGRMHCTRIYYAEMENFKPMIETNTQQFGGAKIPVIDKSDIEFDRELVKWLKARGKKK